MKVAFATAAFSALALAAPALEKRDNIDGTVLNFALTLEHLEATFYRQGLAKFTSDQLTAAGFTAGNNQKQLRQVGKHESQHVAILTAALRAAGVTPVQECTYNFMGALANAETFVTVAGIFEGVGVSAYAGAAQLITSKAYLQDAATILAVEAEHSAFLREGVSRAPAAQTLSNALTPNQVFSIVAPYIVSCPQGNPTLPFKSYAKLTTRNTATTLNRGSQYRFSLNQSINTNRDLFCVFLLQSGNIYSRVFQDGSDHNLRCVVPKGEFGPMGQSYVIITSDQNTVTDSNTVAGPAIVQVFAPFLA